VAGVVVPASLVKTVLLASVRRHLTDAGASVTDATTSSTDDSVDALLRISPPSPATLYAVQVRTRISPGSAAAIVPPTHGRPLIIAPYISESIGDSLRSRDIHYADAAGNMYLRQDGLLLDVRGRHNPTIPRAGEAGKPLRAFRAGGLKILFVLLSDPRAGSTTYRGLAHASGTSLGTVQWVLREITEAGYVSGDHISRRIHRQRELFGRWVEGYSLDLAPRLLLGRFDTTDPGWWKDADDAIRSNDAQWGGETAAHRLNRRFRPGRAIVYADAMPNRLAATYRFRRSDGEGTVEIRQRFWHFDAEPTMTVPTTLIYADLINSAEPRQLEAASHLREHDAVLRRIDGS
jgi:hypothetical protein